MKNELKELIIKTVIRVALVIISIVGVGLSVFGKGFMSSGSLLYFTIQSNIWIMLITLVFIVIDLIGYLKKTDYSKNWLYIIKFIFTVSITLTFAVFFAMLAPSMNNLDYLLSFGNLSVHFLVPILAIIDFLLFDYKFMTNKKTFLFSTIPPLAYYIVSILISFTGYEYMPGVNVPYFFMNYKIYGWFSLSNGLGIIYWFLILSVFVLLVSLLYIKVKNIRYRKIMSK